MQVGLYGRSQKPADPSSGAFIYVSVNAFDIDMRQVFALSFYERTSSTHLPLILVSGGRKEKMMARWLGLEERV